MTAGTRLDGAPPLGAGSTQDAAIAALSRRVAELEHRLDVIKVIVGLVLAAKVVLVAVIVYVLLGGSLVARTGAPFMRAAAASHRPG